MSDNDSTPEPVLITTVDQFGELFQNFFEHYQEKLNMMLNVPLDGSIDLTDHVNNEEHTLGDNDFTKGLLAGLRLSLEALGDLPFRPVPTEEQEEGVITTDE